MNSARASGWDLPELSTRPAERELHRHGHHAASRALGVPRTLGRCCTVRRGRTTCPCRSLRTSPVTAQDAGLRPLSARSGFEYQVPTRKRFSRAPDRNELAGELASPAVRGASWPGRFGDAVAECSDGVVDLLAHVRVGVPHRLSQGPHVEDVDGRDGHQQHEQPSGLHALARYPAGRSCRGQPSAIAARSC